MPYLTEKRKAEVDDGGELVSPGDLTYRMTVRMLEKTHTPTTLEAAMRSEIEHYFDGKQPRYADYAEVLGCLVSTQLEFGRRRQDIALELWTNQWVLERFISVYYYADVAPYEDTKIQENGDVYTCLPA